MTHATVNVGGYSIPLIGIPEDATLQECDLCHDVFPLQSVTLNGKQFLCAKCADERNQKRQPKGKHALTPTTSVAAEIRRQRL